ncbi:hypothetical protein ACFXKD_16020 [Nocardiopsis aegyptia]|uniref:hypothetical protein n=1 Tax=Nocardiopsis aegyptia TaxID=220378 RepID=UPI00366D5BF8
MSMNQNKRRCLKTTYAARVFYARMIWDEMKPGGFISDIITEQTKGRSLGLRIPLLLHGYLRHMNGRTGTTFVSIETLAEDMGYAGNGHDLYKCRKLLEKAGFLTHTKGRGRGAEYALSVPVTLVDRYEDSNGSDYEDITDYLQPEVLDGTENKKPKKEPVSTPYMEDPWKGSLDS